MFLNFQWIYTQCEYKLDNFVSILLIVVKGYESTVVRGQLEMFLELYAIKNNCIGIYFIKEDTTWKIYSSLTIGKH